MGFHLFHHGHRSSEESDLEHKLAVSPHPVLVEFAERDDSVCRMEGQVLDKVLRRFADRVSVLQTYVGSHPAEADRYDITAVPTLILFVDGVEKLRVVGFTPIEELAAALDEALPPAPSAPDAPTTR